MCHILSHIQCRTVTYYQSSHEETYTGTVPYEGGNFANSKMDNFSLIID